jgi:hypothetical protein
VSLFLARKGNPAPTNPAKFWSTRHHKGLVNIQILMFLNRSESAITPHTRLALWFTWRFHSNGSHFLTATDFNEELLWQYDRLAQVGKMSSDDVIYHIVLYQQPHKLGSNLCCLNPNHLEALRIRVVQDNYEGLYATSVLHHRVSIIACSCCFSTGMASPNAKYRTISI